MYCGLPDYVTFPQVFSSIMNPPPSFHTPLTPSGISAIADQLGLQTHQARECLKHVLENVQVIDAKQLDYGPSNIENTGEIGCAVRAQDKVSRLLHLLLKSTAPKNESIEDSWRDLANYSTIALVVREGAWLQKT